MAHRVGGVVGGDVRGGGVGGIGGGIKGAAQCRQRRPKSLSAVAAYCRVKITNALPLLCVTEEKTKNAVPVLKWGSPCFKTGRDL